MPRSVEMAGCEAAGLPNRGRQQFSLLFLKRLIDSEQRDSAEELDVALTQWQRNFKLRGLGRPYAVHWQAHGMLLGQRHAASGVALRPCAGRTDGMSLAAWLRCCPSCPVGHMEQ
jgi:hypothetical protein